MASYDNFQVTTTITIQALLALSLLTLLTSGQRTRMFNPSMPTGTGQFPQTTLNRGGFGSGNSFLRSPFMNANAFLGSNYNNFNPFSQGLATGGNNFFNPYNNRNRREEIYTAIGYDRIDPNSQMRLTITERRSGGMFGYPNGGMGGDDDFERPTSWYVQGTFLTSQLKNKAGNYHVIISEGGRTADGCVSESFGRIISPSMVDVSNPFTQFGVGNQPGILPNKLLVGSSGPTVYASTLDGVSRRQLVGAAIAACEFVQNGVCGGYVPFCGTIAKDVLPAMEVPMADDQPGVVPFNPNGFQNNLNQNGGVFSFTDSFAATVPRADSRERDASTSSSSSLGLLF